MPRAQDVQKKLVVGRRLQQLPPAASPAAGPLPDFAAIEQDVLQLTQVGKARLGACSSACLPMPWLYIKSLHVMGMQDAAIPETTLAMPAIVPAPAPLPNPAAIARDVLLLDAVRQ